jgi:hypothetical protein
MCCDDDHFVDLNDEYFKNVINENVDKYSMANIYDDYVVDDTAEWYNIYESEADG